MDLATLINELQALSLVLREVASDDGSRAPFDHMAHAQFARSEQAEEIADQLDSMISRAQG